MKEENQITESCKCSKKPCLCHKILGLKGLSMIYKVLSIIVILVMLYILGSGWYEIIKEKLPIGQAILWTFQIVITYLFYALILFTISKVLKVLKKIKYAVSNKKLFYRALPFGGARLFCTFIMKKFLIFLLALTFTIPVFCEAIKLKNRLIVNGSVIDRSEYILKVQTSYGIISLNQREIEKIMPDLHRVFLKGGGEYVGTVVDLDDFNLTLNTDSGLVNIDVAQITSMEIYDYEEAAKQKKYVETKIEQEVQEKAEEENKKQKAVAATTMGTSGLNFDEDLEKVFPSRPQETEEVKYIYRTHEDTPEQIKAAAEERAALEALTPAEQEQKIKEEALSFDQNKKRKEGKNYLAAHIGMLNTKLNVDISDLGGPTDFEVSGTGVSFGITYMRKLTNRFWYGGGVDFAMLPKKSMRYDHPSSVPGELRDTQISGQVYDLNALFNFYINPQNPVRVYLTGGANVTSVGIDKSYADYYEKTPGVWVWKSPQTQDTTQTVFGANAGLGLEWTVEDINIGLETRVKYTTLKKELSNSPKTSVLITLKASWFF